METYLAINQKLIKEQSLYKKCVRSKFFDESSFLDRKCLHNFGSLPTIVYTISNTNKMYRKFVCLFVCLLIYLFIYLLS